MKSMNKDNKIKKIYFWKRPVVNYSFITNFFFFLKHKKSFNIIELGTPVASSAWFDRKTRNIFFILVSTLLFLIEPDKK